uniref:Uncharacterized protein n=1 Tax=Acrobeloides nanus TaxID=290746 RepID=A0A914C0M4_9BILA
MRTFLFIFLLISNIYVAQATTRNALTALVILTNFILPTNSQNIVCNSDTDCQRHLHCFFQVAGCKCDVPKRTCV